MASPSILLVAAAAAAAASCPGHTDQNGVCVPTGCRSWYDGCNTCSTDGAVMTCTYMFCATPEEPSCLDPREPKPDCPGHTDQNGVCVPADCSSWFDGCNTCNTEGATMFCTEMFCIQPQEPKCLDKPTPPPYASACATTDSYGNCVDEGCGMWYDGCNYCYVDADTGQLGCTRKYCLAPGEARCQDSPGDDRSARCSDDFSWHKAGTPSKDCSYVKEEAARRCLLKGDGAVYAFEACKESCGTCGTRCEDAVGWHKAGEPDKDCSWVKRLINRCAVMGDDGAWAYQACKFSCYTCEPT